MPNAPCPRTLSILYAPSRRRVPVDNFCCMGYLKGYLRFCLVSHSHVYFFEVFCFFSKFFCHSSAAFSVLDLGRYSFSLTYLFLLCVKLRSLLLFFWRAFSTLENLANNVFVLLCVRLVVCNRLRLFPVSWFCRLAAHPLWLSFGRGR